MVRWRILGPVLLQVHHSVCRGGWDRVALIPGSLSAIWERKGPSVSPCWDHLLDWGRLHYQWDDGFQKATESAWLSTKFLALSSLGSHKAEVILRGSAGSSGHLGLLLVGYQLRSPHIDLNNPTRCLNTVCGINSISVGSLPASLAVGSQAPLPIFLLLPTA